MQRKTGTSSTTMKAFQVLEAVAEYSRAVSLNDISEKVRMDKSTTYRMLATLEEAGYVIRHEASKQYSLSYKVVSLSRNLLAENEVSRLVHESLTNLRNITSETVEFSVLEGMQTILVQKVKGTQLVSVDFQIGDRSLLHCTSIGKALLAFQDIRMIERVIQAGLPKKTENTITEGDDFRREMQIVRSQGYAIDDHEFAPNLRCIALPIFESGGRVRYGISISGPDSRFTIEYLELLKKPLMEESRRLSNLLGGTEWKETTPDSKVSSV
jgi:IclR family transcriptional regulator, KDG regulon repressor